MGVETQAREGVEEREQGRGQGGQAVEEAEGWGWGSGGLKAEVNKPESGRVSQVLVAGCGGEGKRHTAEVGQMGLRRQGKP